MNGFFNEIAKFLSEKKIDYIIKTNGEIKYFHYRGFEHEIFLLPIAINAIYHVDAIEKQEHYKKFIDSLDNVIIITEDRWRRATTVFQKRILSHLEKHIPIYARNCEVKRIDKITATSFMDENHSYGSAISKYSYGLFLKRYTGHIALDKLNSSRPNPGSLIAVAEFSGARKWKKEGEIIRSYEWVRYASLPHIRISGGMGKLLNAFIKEVKPDDIMSYADLEWSNGDVYKKLGFKREKDKEAVDFIISPTSWERRAIKKKPFPTSSEFRNMYYFRNFGSAKYRLKLKDYQ